MSVLLVDIGNSRIKARIADLAIDAADDADRGWLGPTRVADSELPERIADPFRDLAAPIDAVVVSNVANVRHGDAVARAATARWPEASVHLVAAEAARCGVVNGYRQPGKLGADRWMALIGARALQPGQSVLVCSFGTATTIDLLVAASSGDQATFVGGLILPGFDAMAGAMAATTARLPHSAADSASTPPRDFADRTEDAMWSGVVAAQVGAVERSLRLARARLDGGSLRCCLTGGNAALVAPVLLEGGHVASVSPDLVLQGMRRWAREALGTTVRAVLATTA